MSTNQRQLWEYLRLQSPVQKVADLDQKTLELGRQGWEMVSTVFSASKDAFGGSFIHMWFKRPI